MRPVCLYPLPSPFRCSLWSSVSQLVGWFTICVWVFFSLIKCKVLVWKNQWRLMVVNHNATNGLLWCQSKHAMLRDDPCCELLWVDDGMLRLPSSKVNTTASYSQSQNTSHLFSVILQNWSNYSGSRRQILCKCSFERAIRDCSPLEGAAEHSTWSKTKEASPSSHLHHSALALVSHCKAMNPLSKQINAEWWWRDGGSGGAAPAAGLASSTRGQEKGKEKRKFCFFLRFTQSKGVKFPYLLTCFGWHTAKPRPPKKNSW